MADIPGPIFWLGGSPCSGKSSIAALLAEQYGLRAYHCDDGYERHKQACDPLEHPRLYTLGRMSWDQLWTRPVDVQVAEELELYREEWAFILDDVRAFAGGPPVLVEGAALLPKLITPLLSRSSVALYILPVPAFQRTYYSQRPWVEEILRQCRDPDAAWANWMDRDQRFGEYVAQDAEARGLRVEWTDGSRTIAELAALAAAHFGLR